MVSFAVLYRWIEANTIVDPRASDVEESMTNLKYAIVEEEMVTSTVDSVVDEKHPKPFVVSQARKRSATVLTRRVEAALDAAFANGSMPA